MRAALVLALVASGCSYDYSRVPIGTPPSDGGGGADAGPRFTCDPVVQTCSAMLHCGMVSDTSGQITARCVLPGSGTASAPCVGPEGCAPGYYCRSTPAGSTSCQSFCTDVAPSCADGRACDTATELFSIGTHVGHPCL